MSANLQWYGPGVHGAPSSNAPVCLPAYPLDGRMWGPLAAALAPDYGGVWVANVAGFGGSLLPAEEPDLLVVARELARAWQRPDLGPRLVIGCSLGGYLGLALAQEHPELVRGLVMIDTKAVADDDAARATRLQVAQLAESDPQAAVGSLPAKLLGVTARTRHPALLSEVALWAEQAPGPAIAWVQRAMAARPARVEVAREFTRLVIHGSEDEIMPVGIGEQLARESQARLELVAAGHLPPLEVPTEVARLVREVHPG